MATFSSDKPSRLDFVSKSCDYLKGNTTAATGKTVVRRLSETLFQGLMNTAEECNQRVQNTLLEADSVLMTQSVYFRSFIETAHKLQRHLVHDNITYSERLLDAIIKVDLNDASPAPITSDMDPFRRFFKPDFDAQSLIMKLQALPLNSNGSAILDDNDIIMSPLSTPPLYSPVRVHESDRIYYQNKCTCCGAAAALAATEEGNECSEDPLFQL